MADRRAILSYEHVSGQIIRFFRCLGSPIPPHAGYDECPTMRYISVAIGFEFWSALIVRTLELTWCNGDLDRSRSLQDVHVYAAGQLFHSFNLYAIRPCAVSFIFQYSITKLTSLRQGRQSCQSSFRMAFGWRTLLLWDRRRW